jgi:amino acid adenylation domain-containing protein/non-ribosomal peptide synthase protein (TIGR01720 family)
MRFSKDSRVLQFASHTFDVSNSEIFTTLMHGGCVCVPSEHERMDDLAGAIVRMDVNWLFLTPTVAHLLQPEQVPNLKVLALGGEIISQDLIDRWSTKVTLINSYGASEASIWTSNAQLTNSEFRNNIGRGLGSLLWVTYPENHDRLSPIGSIGELLIDGPIVGQGYLNAPEKTRGAFVEKLPWLPTTETRRMYRTGDLVRYNVDGSLEYVGRKDSQIKLHGQRIELGEIEHHLAAQLADLACLSAVELITMKESQKHQFLAAFVQMNESNGTQDVSNDYTIPLSDKQQAQFLLVQAKMQESLPTYMVPSVFIMMRKMTLNTSNKLDRNQLRRIGSELSELEFRRCSLANVSKRAPKTSTEKRLQSLWAEVLGIVETSKIGADDSFFRLGGDSITAMRLVALAQSQQERVPLTVADIFRYSQLSAMAQAVDENGRSQAVTGDIGAFDLIPSLSKTNLLHEAAVQCGVSEEDIEDIYPTTPLQEGLITITSRKQSAYVLRMTFKLPDSIPLDQFQAAFQKTVDSHPILRTRVIHTANGSYQIILRQESILWHSASSLEAYTATDKELSITHGQPLTRYGYVEESAQSRSPIRYFVWTAHHAIYDGWTVALLFKQVESVFSHGSAPKLPPFNRFISYLSSVEPEKVGSYWRGQLSGSRPSTFPLPAVGQQVRATKRQQHQISLPSRSGSGILISTILRAAWALLISRYSESEDVIFGATLSGRNAPVAGIEQTLGPTITTVPVRITMNGEQAVGEFLQVIQDQATDMIPFEHTGLQNIRRQLNVEQQDILDLKNLFIVQPAEESGEQSSFLGLELVSTGFDDFDSIALILECRLGQGAVDVEVRHDPMVASATQIKWMLGQFDHIVQQLSVEPNDIKVEEIELCSKEDYGQILIWNGKTTPTIDERVHDVFTAASSTRPNAVAIRSWDGDFTYKELDKLSNKLVQHLIDLGVGSAHESKVLLCFDKSAWAILSMLAVLKAGGACVALSPAYPRLRIQQIIEITGAQLILASPTHNTMLEGLVPRVLAVDSSLLARLSSPSLPTPTLTTPSSAAFVVFTSGSTGVPKGIVLEHAALCTSLMAHAKAMDFKEDSRVSQFANYTFDVSIGEIFATLFMGGCVCVPSEHERLNDLEGFLGRNAVTIAVLTPTVTSSLRPHNLPSLQTLVLTGEAASAQDVAPWSANQTIFNAYGPAEATVWAGISEISGDVTSANIGTGSGANFWITEPGDHSRLSAIGTVGELLIEGPILARGYLNDAEKTAAAFVVGRFWFFEGSTPRRMYKTGDLARYAPDGSIVYIGRKDTQVKLHGQRIELSEVEYHISARSGVRAVVVIHPINGPCKNQLVAVVSFSSVVRESNTPESLQLLEEEHQTAVSAQIAAVQDQLRERMPEYMIPRVWVPVYLLPQSASGKLDRLRMNTFIQDMDEDTYRKATQFQAAKEEHRRPMTAIEAQLQAIWSRTLNIPAADIGPDRSFLSLGGDSITAMQITSLCRAEGLMITVQDTLRFKTISQIALQARSTKSALYSTEEEFETSFNLSPIQQFYFDKITSGEQGAKHPHHYNQSFFVRVMRPIEKAKLFNSLEEVVKQHSMLRARFKSTQGGQWTQLITREAKGSYRFNAHAISSLEDAVPLVLSAQTSLDIENGPVFSAELFTIGDQKEQYLSLIAHHLIIDLVSWRIILGDIEGLLQSEVNTLSLARPLPFQTWSQLQVEYAQQHLKPPRTLPYEVPPADLTYWGMVNQPNRFSDEVEERFTLDKTTTSLLFGAANESFRTEPVEIVLAALLSSFKQVFRDRATTPPIYTEGHGREPWDGGIDLSRTVGWFTTLLPFHPELAESNNIIDEVRRTKDCRRRVPGNGWPYFAARYLTEDGAKRFHEHDNMEIAFNYLGRYQQLEREDALLRFIDVEAGDGVSNIGPAIKRLALIDIAMAVMDETTLVTFTYNRRMQHIGQVLSWVATAKNTLDDAVRKLQNMSTTYTLADFPLLPDLTYNGLEKLSGERLNRVGVSLDQVEDIYPCSPLQQGILLSQAKAPETYMVVQMFEILSATGSVDHTRVQRAWQTVVDRHPTLRTIFIETSSDAGGMSNQVVRKSVSVPTSYISSDSEDGAELLRSRAALEYDPTASSPSHRLTLCRTPAGRLFCKLEFSHTLVDGTSIPVLVRDLALAYAEALPATPGPLYSDYIAYLQEQSMEESLKYWSSHLEGLHPCHLPALTSKTKQQINEYRTTKLKFAAAELNAFCQKQDVTLANLFQAAWTLVLACYTGQQEVCFGYLASGREVPVKNIEEAVGPFINMLVCRCNVSATSITQLLKRIQENYLSSLPHQHCSLADIQHILNLSGDSLFNTVMSLQRGGASVPGGALDNSDISIIPAEGQDPTEVSACS